jgi:hypothetical protein
MTITYEWIVETLDTEPVDDPDIIEVDHFDLYKYAAEFSAAHQPSRVALVREVGNDDEGLIERMWAYVRDGGLPEHFEFATDLVVELRVPKRFHDEIARGVA